MANEVNFESEGRLSRREDALVDDLKGEVVEQGAESEKLLTFDDDLRSIFKADSAILVFFLLLVRDKAKNFFIISWTSAIIGPICWILGSEAVEMVFWELMAAICIPAASDRSTILFNDSN